MKEIRDRILQRMAELDLKSVDLVRMVGVSKSTVSSWVNGKAKPDGRNLVALCVILKCNAAWLVNGTEGKRLAQTTTFSYGSEDLGARNEKDARVEESSEVKEYKDRVSGQLELTEEETLLVTEFRTLRNSSKHAVISLIYKEKESYS